MKIWIKTLVTSGLLVIVIPVVLAAQAGSGDFFFIWGNPFSSDDSLLLFQRQGAGFQLRCSDGSCEAPVHDSKASDQFFSRSDGGFYKLPGDRTLWFEAAAPGSAQLLASDVPNRWSPPGSEDCMLGFESQGSLLEYCPASGILNLNGWTVPGRAHRLLYDSTTPHSAFVNLQQEEGGLSYRLNWNEQGKLSVQDCGMSLDHPFLSAGLVYGFSGREVVARDCAGVEITYPGPDIPTDRVGPHLRVELGGITVATQDAIWRVDLQNGAWAKIATAFSDGVGAEGQAVASLSRNGTLLAYNESGEVRIVPTDAAPPTLGLYFDRARNGHGFDLQRLGDNWFLLFYTYKDDGTPLWYLATGAFSAGGFTGTAQQFDYDSSRTPPQQAIAGTGGPVSVDFLNGTGTPGNACDDGIDRSSAVATASFDFTLDGHTDSWCVEPFVFGSGHPAVDFTGSWYNSSDTGWGMTIYTQGDSSDETLVVVLYYYDAAGQPRWALGVAPGPDFSADVTVPMSQFSGYCLTCTPTPPVDTHSGTVTLRMTTPSQDLAAGNVAIVNVDFLGSPGGSWVRNEGIQMLSELP